MVEYGFYGVMVCYFLFFFLYLILNLVLWLFGMYKKVKIMEEKIKVEGFNENGDDFRLYSIVLLR